MSNEEINKILEPYINKGFEPINSDTVFYCTSDYVKRYDDFKDYYSRNPDKFAEDFYGVKLKLWQKMILKIMFNKKGK